MPKKKLKKKPPRMPKGGVIETEIQMFTQLPGWLEEIRTQTVPLGSLGRFTPEVIIIPGEEGPALFTTLTPKREPLLAMHLHSFMVEAGEGGLRRWTRYLLGHVNAEIIDDLCSNRITLERAFKRAEAIYVADYDIKGTESKGLAKVDYHQLPMSGRPVKLTLAEVLAPPPPLS